MEFGESEPISGDGFWFVKDVGLKGYRGFLVFLRELIQNGYDAYLSRDDAYKAKNPLKYMVFHDKIKQLIIFRNNGLPLSDLDIQRLKKPGKYALEGNNNRIGEHNSGILTGFRITNEILFRSSSKILSLAIDWDKKTYSAQLSEKTDYFLDGTEVWISYKDKIDEKHKWYLNFPIEKSDLEQLNSISNYFFNEIEPIFLFLDCFKECILIERNETKISYVSIQRSESNSENEDYKLEYDIRPFIVELKREFYDNLQNQAKIASIIEKCALNHKLHEKQIDSKSIFEQAQELLKIQKLLMDLKTEKRNKVHESEIFRYFVFEKRISKHVVDTWPYFYRLKERKVDLPKIFLENRLSSNPEIHVAFLLSKNNELIPISGKIYVFLPSSLDIGLHFHINARFKSSTSRESLVFEGLDGIYNKYVIQETSKMLFYCFESIRAASNRRLNTNKLLKLTENIRFPDIDLRNYESIDAWYEILISDIQKTNINFSEIYETCDKEISNHFFTLNNGFQPLSSILIQPSNIQKEMQENYLLLLKIVQTAYKDRKFIAYPIKSHKIHNKLTRSFSRGGFGLSYLSFSMVFQLINDTNISSKMDLAWWNDAVGIALRYSSFETQQITYKIFVFPNDKNEIVLIEQLMIPDCDLLYFDSLLFWIPEDIRPNSTMLRNHKKYLNFLIQLMKNSKIMLQTIDDLLKQMENKINHIKLTSLNEKNNEFLSHYVSTLEFLSKKRIDLKIRTEKIILIKNKPISPREIRDLLVVSDNPEFNELRTMMSNKISEIDFDPRYSASLMPFYEKIGIFYTINIDFVASFFNHLLSLTDKEDQDQIIGDFLKSIEIFSKISFSEDKLKEKGKQIRLPYKKNMISVDEFFVIFKKESNIDYNTLLNLSISVEIPILIVDCEKSYNFLLNLGMKKILEPEKYALLIENVLKTRDSALLTHLFEFVSDLSADWKNKFAEQLYISNSLPILQPNEYQYILDSDERNITLFGKEYGAFPIINKKTLEKLSLQIKKFALIEELIEKIKNIKKDSVASVKTKELERQTQEKIAEILEYVELGYLSGEYAIQDLIKLGNIDFIFIKPDLIIDDAIKESWITPDYLIFDDIIGINKLIFGKTEKFFGKSSGYPRDWYRFFESLEGIYTLSNEKILDLFDQLEKNYDSTGIINIQKYHGLYLYLSQIFNHCSSDFKNSLKKKRCIISIPYSSLNEQNVHQNQSSHQIVLKSVILKKPSDVYFADEPNIVSKFLEKGKIIYVPLKIDFKTEFFFEQIGIRKSSEVIHKSLLKTEIQGNEKFFLEDKMKLIFQQLEPIIFTLIQHRLGSQVADQVFSDFKTLKYVACKDLAINFSFDGTPLNIKKEIILNIPSLYFTQTLVNNFEHRNFNDLIEEFSILIANNQVRDIPFIRELLSNALNERNPRKYLRERGFQPIDSFPFYPNLLESKIIGDSSEKMKDNNQKMNLDKILKQRKSIETDYRFLPADIKTNTIRDFIRTNQFFIRGRVGVVEIDESLPDLDLIQIILDEAFVYVPKGLSDSDIRKIKTEFADLKDLKKFIESLNKVVDFLGFKNCKIQSIIVFEPITAIYSEGTLSVNLMYAGSGNLYNKLRNEIRYLISWLILICHELAHHFESAHTLIWQNRFETLISLVIEKFDEIKRLI